MATNYNLFLNLSNMKTANEEPLLPTEEPENKFSTDPAVRLGFVRKVFGIVGVQLLFTSCFVALAIQSDSFKAILATPTYVFVVIALYIGTFCMLACCGLDRKVPVNYLLLFIFTTCVAWMVGCIAARYDANTVI